MAIKIFFHVACMGHYLDVVKEQMDALEESGLPYDMIYVCITDRKKTKQIKELLPPKSKICYFSRLDQFEYPSMFMIKEYTKPEDKIFYMHTKSVSRTGDARIAGDKWRQYMTWGCIERYKEHLEALKTHDISGVQLTRLDAKFTRLCGGPICYAGSFWWANGSYIEKLEAPEIDLTNRWKTETWPFTANPKAFDAHNLTNGGLITTKNTFALKSFNRKTYDPDYVEKLNPEMLHYRYEVLNLLINQFKYKNYLEIGYFKGDNFKEIKCKNKVSVDPAVNACTFKLTSDDFFTQNNKKFDCVFIDGYHEREQVLRDILNSLDCLEEGGTIVLHDMLPETPRECRHIDNFVGGWVWLGTSYEAFIELRKTRPDLSMHVLDLDFGVGIIRKGKQEIYKTDEVIDFSYYFKNRKELMNIIDPEDAEAFIEGLK